MPKLVVNIADVEWQTHADGVRRRTIYQEGPWIFAYVCIPPQTEVAEHVHPENEFVYIIEGALWEGDKHYGAGTFLINDKGSRHTTGTREQGCTLLVVSCGRIEFVSQSS